jgi:lipoprotein-anchoring transpeptidase ErfK/SrfK
MRRIPLYSACALAFALLASTAEAMPDKSASLSTQENASWQGPFSDAEAPEVSPIPRETVPYDGPYSPGTIIVSTNERRLYYVLPGHQALRYGVGVGRPGFIWAGASHIANKREWPDWRPPAEMIKR